MVFIKPNKFDAAELNWNIYLNTFLNHVKFGKNILHRFLNLFNNYIISTHKDNTKLKKYQQKEKISNNKQRINAKYYKITERSDFYFKISTNYHIPI